MTDILIVDDDKDNSISLKKILETEHHDVRIAFDSHGCFAEVGRHVPYVIILDLWLKQIEWDGMKLLKVLHKNHPDTAIIILSAHANVPITAEAMQSGAFMVLVKPVNPIQMLAVVKRAMNAASLKYSNHAFGLSNAATDTALIGQSQAMTGLVSRLDRIAPMKSHVMINGGVGSGKQVAARYLHRQSKRPGNFVVANLSTVREDDCDRLLFGREAGRSEIESGLIEQAHGGTLYLNRLENMPLPTQKRLVATIANQKFRRENGNDLVDADFRVVGATLGRSRNFVEDGRISDDLHSRIGIQVIDVPALESRREDIEALCEHFLSLFAKVHSRPTRSLDSAALHLLENSAWPGNVSQLKNLIERIVILDRSDGMIGIEEAQGVLNEAIQNAGSAAAGRDIFNMPIRTARKMFELEYLNRQIERCGGNVSKAAEFVEMDRTSLHRKLKQLRDELADTQSGMSSDEAV